MVCCILLNKGVCNIWLDNRVCKIWLDKDECNICMTNGFQQFPWHMFCNNFTTVHITLLQNLKVWLDWVLYNTWFCKRVCNIWLYKDVCSNILHCNWGLQHLTCYIFGFAAFILTEGIATHGLVALSIIWLNKGVCKIWLGYGVHII